MRVLILTACLGAALSFFEGGLVYQGLQARGLPVSLYLKNSASLTGGELLLSDIAIIETSSALSDSTELPDNLVIPSALYADGIVDRSELRALLNGATSLSFRITGTAVKIEMPAGSVNRASGTEESSGIVRGRKVKVVYQGNGVRVETSGTALTSGAPGSDVRVRVRAGRQIQGRVIGYDMVEVQR